MRLRRPSLTAAILILAAVPISLATAQGDIGLRRGERVRISIVGPPPVPAAERCTGLVDALVRDTVVLRRGDCPEGTFHGDLRVLRGDRGYRLEHAGIGFLAGAVAGGVITKLAVGDGCRVEGCEDGGFVAGIMTLYGTGIGALTGTVVGALLPAGPQWVEAGRARPLRVGGLVLQPGLRVSLVRSHAPPAR